MIVRRSRYYRNTAVATVMTAFVSTGSALLMHELRPLACLLLLIPGCGAFFYMDQLALARWRANLLALWTSRSLDIAAFRQAVRSHPQLPADTLEAMLGTLPSAGDLPAEQRVGRATRAAVAAATHAFHRARQDAMLLNVVASGVAVAAALASLWLRAYWPLYALLLLLLRPLGGALLASRREHTLAAELDRFRAREGFSAADYARLAGSLQ